MYACACLSCVRFVYTRSNSACAQEHALETALRLGTDGFLLLTSSRLPSSKCLSSGTAQSMTWAVKTPHDDSMLMHIGPLPPTHCSRTLHPLSTHLSSPSLSPILLSLITLFLFTLSYVLYLSLLLCSLGMDHASCTQISNMGKGSTNGRTGRDFPSLQPS